MQRFSTFSASHSKIAGKLRRHLCQAVTLAAALAMAGGGCISALAQPAAPTDQQVMGPANVALTFDDLPGMVLRPDQAYSNATNRALVKQLRRHHYPAIGFVNEGKLGPDNREGQGGRKHQIAILRRWVRAGFDLGNHTFSHSSPNAIGPVAYIDDIAGGERVIRPMMDGAHRRLQWFRHPYLETGSPAAVKAQIDTWLAGHRYRIAPVTIDCDDWQFAEPYDDAVMRGDQAAAHRIRATYLAYSERTITWYRRAAHALFGRDIAYVMLLHDTRLNADSLDALAMIFHKQDLHPISLAQAMRDPAYRTPDDYSGKDGIEWLERWSDTLKKDLPWSSYQDVPDEIVAAYDKVDNDLLVKPAATSAPLPVPPAVPGPAR